jgi:hypothetical protein
LEIINTGEGEERGEKRGREEEEESGEKGRKEEEERKIREGEAIERRRMGEEEEGEQEREQKIPLLDRIRSCCKFVACASTPYPSEVISSQSRKSKAYKGGKK